MGNGVSSKKGAIRVTTEDAVAEVNHLKEELAAIKAQNVELNRLVTAVYTAVQQGGGLPAIQSAATSAPAAQQQKQPTAKATAAAAPEASENKVSDIQVMLSINVRTMKDTAERLDNFLESHGVKTWMCTEMGAGVEFRAEIVDAVDACTVFVPLINNAWALSPECEAEFNYAYRRNLTSKSNPRLPVILPVCFPDLDWNAHRHVRLLLASTNALVYQPDKEEQLFSSLAVSMKRSGVKFGVGSDITSWDTDQVCKWLQELLLRPVKETHLSGSQLKKMTDTEFMDVIGLSKFHVQAVRKHLPRPSEASKEEAAEEDHSSDDESDDPFEGMYKVIARTINDHDGNVTNSNEFLVTLRQGGISSSGCVWSAGTLHNNYSGVTCVWQGQYRKDGSFSFLSTYSNNTREEYAGRFVPQELGLHTVNMKYAWWGYGKQSYGSADTLLLRLSASEEASARQELQKMLDSKEDRLHNLSSIGRSLEWGLFEGTKAAFVAERTKQEAAASNWLQEPQGNPAIVEAGGAFVVRFKRPPNANSEKDRIGICLSDKKTLWDSDAWFATWNLRVQHGIIFYQQLVPPPGDYHLVYFVDGSPSFTHPLKVVPRF